MASQHAPSRSERRAPQAAMLPDGRRLHLQDGPIDLIVEAVGEGEAVRRAYEAAVARFTGLLDALCAELAALRAPAGAHGPAFVHPVARRMGQAVAPFAADVFITPMAAVAGAVAEDILSALVLPGISRAYVNNGGDIALHLPRGARFAVGLVDQPERPRLIGAAEIDADGPVRGVATSGWRGRSFSLGVADAVTILAPSAAVADAAASVVANAVDLPWHTGVVRVPACELLPESDLGTLPVTRYVPELTAAERAEALDAGLAVARDLAARGLICAAALHVQGETVSTGDGLLPLLSPMAARPSQPQEECAHA
ncbi:MULTISPECIES: UPF0280 family protein [unclassified Xanthobacter]|uniref:UPF0280 family protein n=1 Tax=unclassified Xanthobacter TaxID=2623496 RepID=UPI001F30DA19|nr:MULTISPECIES: UPF0280 family protein [unclassified Xanthobacter]